MSETGNDKEKNPTGNAGSEPRGSFENQGKEKSESLTHNIAGVAVTVSIKEEKSDDKNQGEQKDDDKGDKKNENQKKKPPIYKRPKVIVIVIIVAIFIIVCGILFWLHARQFVSTNDAYIDGNVTQISARVSAPVVALHMNDNQLVHKGDLLLELDPTDFQVTLDQAKAQAISSQGRFGASAGANCDGLCVRCAGAGASGFSACPI